MLERTLAFHCAPALAGIKPANLVSCCLTAHPHLEQEVEQLNQALNASGIYLQRLCCCGKRMLLLVYRRQTLEKHLLDRQMQGYLKRAGYPQGGLDDLLQHLQKRLDASGEFPHEMGVFLGYPLEDVEGFQRYGGKNCKLVGYWKVYGDADKAQKLFQRFTCCRNALCARIGKGTSLTELFRIA